LSTPDLARARHGGVNILLGEATGLHNGLLNTWMASSRAADEGSCQVTTCALGRKGDSIHSVLRTCAVAGYQQAQPTCFHAASQEQEGFSTGKLVAPASRMAHYIDQLQMAGCLC